LKVKVRSTESPETATAEMNCPDGLSSAAAGAAAAAGMGAVKADGVEAVAPLRETL
jgi:hypothetical protein